LETKRLNAMGIFEAPEGAKLLGCEAVILRGIHLR